MLYGSKYVGIIVDRENYWSGNENLLISAGTRRFLLHAAPLERRAG